MQDAEFYLNIEFGLKTTWLNLIFKLKIFDGVKYLLKSDPFIQLLKKTYQIISGNLRIIIKFELSLVSCPPNSSLPTIYCGIVCLCRKLLFSDVKAKSKFKKN